MRCLLALGFIACVPAQKVDDPRGGVRLQLVGSPATNGEPFVTSDGWTITFDAIYVRFGVNAESLANPCCGGGVGGDRIVNPRIVCDVDATAISVGRANIAPELSSPTPPDVILVNDNACGTPPEVVPRFATYADNDKPTAPDDDPESFEATGPFASSGSTPAVIVTGHGDQNGESVRFDFALSIGDEDRARNELDPCHFDEDSDECKAEIDEIDKRYQAAGPGEGPDTFTVPTNAAVLVRYAFHGELLFVPFKGGDPQFSWIAKADQDHDGQTTFDELALVQVRCATWPDGTPETDEYGRTYCATGADVMSTNLLGLMETAPLK